MFIGQFNRGCSSLEAGLCSGTHKTLPSLQGAGSYDVPLFYFHTGIVCENCHNYIVCIMLAAATIYKRLGNRCLLPPSRLSAVCFAACRPVCIPYIAHRPWLTLIQTVVYQPLPSPFSTTSALLWPFGRWISSTGSGGYSGEGNRNCTNTTGDGNRNCTNCTNCYDCRNCTNCNNCTGCRNCTNCNDCVDCRNCTDGNGLRNARNSTS